MSFMDMFKSAPVVDAASSVNPQGNPPAGQPDLSNSPPSRDANGKMPGTNAEPVNPLDAYASMFDNAGKNSAIQAPTFKLDSKVVDEVASKMDFTSGLDQAMVQKALSGDAQALMATIQAVSQNSYKAAISHGTSLTDSFINQRSEYEKKQVESGVHKQLTNQALSSAPNFAHPVIKQELNRVADQFARANPDASPVEVAEAAKRYITDLSSALNPAAPAASSPSESMDWSKYLGVDK